MRAPALEMSFDELLAAARSRAGLTDWGDERFMPAFRRMIEAVNAESTFSRQGRELSRERFLRLLVNRLRATADFKAHPEILEETIAPPLVILGLPRTGSTKLQRLMGQADVFRSLLMWQGYNVAPFAGGAGQEPDPRIGAAAEFLAWRSSRHTNISKAHYSAAREPEEELYLIELSFANWAAGGYYEMPSYLNWLRTVDRDYVYDYVHRMLQYLQWQHHRGKSAKPWVLKSPPNLGHEAAILKHFPGAHFVMLHRDPIEAVSSLISLTHSMRHQYLAVPPSLEALASWLLQEVADILDRHMAWRTNLPNAPVIDVSYRDVADNEMEVVERIFSFCGMSLNGADRSAMQVWSTANGRHHQGEHVYSLKGTGLTDWDILKKLEKYRHRFAANLPTDL